MRFAIALLAVGCHERSDRVPVSALDPGDRIATAAHAEPPRPAACPSDAIQLGEGLTHERRALGAIPAAGLEPCFDVVRADVARFHLRLLTKAQDGASQPAPQWREHYNLVAVTNAGMFHEQGNPVGLLVQDGTALSKDNPAYGGYLAFDPVAASDTPAIITGRDCPGFDLAALRSRYRSLLQANRLVGCTGEPLAWADPKQYSASAIGLDRAGHVVFIHARAAVRMTELARAVATLGVSGALFLEGGPEASLVVRGDTGELARVGSYESGFVENDENQSFWWLPNVIGLEAKRP
jgi:hypothetical protein